MVPLLAHNRLATSHLWPKLNWTHIWQYPGFVVQGLIKIPKSAYSNYTKQLSSSFNQKCLIFHRMFEYVSTIQIFQVTPKYKIVRTHDQQYIDLDT